MSRDDMKTEYWDQLEAELDELLASSATVRSQRLAAIAEVRPDDAAYLREWLEGIETPEGFLDQPEMVAVGPQSGHSLGPWRLVRKIAEGGMGTVWLAERADGSFAKQVAIKFLREDSGRLRERLVQERKVLARLEHPGIARLLDGSTAVDGVPYLVAEFVDGSPLDTWCKQHKPDLTKCLDLFRQIGEAVAYAHANLVVHRDLKPRNIMVDRNDRTRLLDFGIAKLVDPSDTAETAERALTPEYAAPEQVTGSPITTRTDVYALGALLYFLLTGQPPLALRGLPLSALVQRVCNEMPAPPSAIAKPGVAAASALQGDLDAIVLKALSKDPAQRYASVELFLEDIDAWLQHLPVKASGNATWYRLRRFGRRHWLVLAASAAVFLALCVGMAGTLWQARIAEYQRDMAQQQRDASERESARLTAVKDFMYQLLRQEQSGTKLSLSDLLARAESGLAASSGTPNAARALAASVLLTIYRARGDPASAARVVETVADIDSADLPGRVAAELDCLRGNLLSLNGDDQAALQAVQRGIERAQELAGPQRNILGSCLGIRGSIANKLNDVDVAVKYYQDAIRELEKLAVPLQGDMATVLDNFGNVLEGAGRPQEAEAAYRRALALLDEIHLGESWEAAVVIGNLANLFKSSYGLPREAVPLFEKALGIRRKEIGASAGVAQQLINFSSVYVSVNEPERALALLDEAEAMQRDLVKPVSMHFAQLHVERGKALTLLRRLKDAGNELEQARALYLKLLPPNHPFFQSLRNDKAELALASPAAQRDLKKEQEELATDIARMREPKARDVSQLPRTLRLSAEIAYLQDDRAQAETLAVEARNLYAKAAGESAWQTAQCDLLLGELASARGNRELALQKLETASEHLAAALGPEHPSARRARESLAAADVKFAN